MTYAIHGTSRVPREDCVRLLESIGIACYEEEPTEVLREALHENIKDGNLSPEDVEGIA